VGHWCGLSHRVLFWAPSFRVIRAHRACPHSTFCNEVCGRRVCVGNKEGLEVIHF
jgi:hypothetical protein